MTAFLVEAVGARTNGGERMTWREARPRLPRRWADEWDRKIAGEIGISLGTMGAVGPGGVGHTAGYVGDGKDATMRASELPGELVDRGIYWQIGGFAVVALSSAVLLVEFAGSDYRAFLYFEVAATKLYWAFVIPLAGLFDGVRKMF